MIAQSLSIVLILRRNPPRLAAAINLLLAAAARVCEDFELILVTCSDDRQLREAADRLAARHQEVLVLHHTAGRSYAYALRDAWSVARGELLLAIDDDGAAAARILPQLHAAMRNHSVALAYRISLPRGLRAEVAMRSARRKIGVPLHDPTLRLAMFDSELITLFPEPVDGQLVHGQIYTAAAAAGMPVAQIAVTPTSNGEMVETATFAEQSGLPQRRTTIGGVLVAVLGGIWLLRRWLPGARDDQS